MTHTVSNPVQTLVYCVVKHSRPPDLKSSSNLSLPFAWITGPRKRTQLTIEWWVLKWNIVSVNTFSSKPQDKHQAAWNYFGQLLIWPISKHMLFSKWPRASSSLGTYIWIMMDLPHSYLIQELILDATFSRHWTVCVFLIFKSGLQFSNDRVICLFLKWPSMDMCQQRQLVQQTTALDKLAYLTIQDVTTCDWFKCLH